jgi:lipoyl-dependent peroxiredoxin
LARGATKKKRGIVVNSVHAHNDTLDGTLRHGTVRWLADPPHGEARIRVGSDAFTSLPLSVPGGRTRPGETTPGELLAAAYCAFMATNLAQRLERDGVPADELVVGVWCRLSPDAIARSVEALDIEVRGRVPGLNGEGFRAAAGAALALSRKSLAMSNDLHTELRVSLTPRGRH